MYIIQKIYLHKNLLITINSIYPKKYLNTNIFQVESSGIIIIPKYFIVIYADYILKKILFNQTYFFHLMCNVEIVILSSQS